MQDGNREKTEAEREEMDGERSQFDNCIEVLSDGRAVGDLLGRSIVCTNKTHTRVVIND